MINYYVVLEIQNFSDVPTIKKAYRRLSKKYHPDVNKDPFANSYFQKIYARPVILEAKQLSQVFKYGKTERTVLNQIDLKI